MKPAYTPLRRLCALSAVLCVSLAIAHAQTAAAQPATQPATATVAAQTASAAAAAPDATTAVAPAPEAKPQGAINKTFDWINAQSAKINNDYGVALIFDYEADVLGNPTGGLTRGVAYSQTILYGCTLDLEKIAHIKGASFTLTGLTTGASNLSNKIGNVFTAAQTFVGNGTYLYQAYWQQLLCDNNLQIQAGRLNTNTFASLPAFGLQVSGGVNGNPTSLFVNTNFLSEPYSIWGANATATVSEQYYVAGGLYQASDDPGKNHGLDFSFTDNTTGLFMMAETGWTPTFGAVTKEDPGLPGVYKVGGYSSTAPYQYFNGNGTENFTYGFYGMGQQMVWRNAANPNNNFSLWGGMTYSPQDDVAEMTLMGFGGFVWQGLIPNRDQDQLLGAVMVGNFSAPYAQASYTPAAGSPTCETVLDFSYVITINKNFFIQPDIQYIIRPGGLTSTQNALVIGVQFGLSL